MPVAPFRPALRQHRASRRSGIEIDCVIGRSGPDSVADSGGSPRVSPSDPWHVIGGRVDDLVAREKAEMPSWQAFVAVSRSLCCLPFVQLDPQSCHPCTDTPSKGTIRFTTKISSRFEATRLGELTIGSPTLAKWLFVTRCGLLFASWCWLPRAFMRGQCRCHPIRYHFGRHRTHKRALMHYMQWHRISSGCALKASF